MFQLHHLCYQIFTLLHISQFWTFLKLLYVKKCPFSLAPFGMLRLLQYYIILNFIFSEIQFTSWNVKIASFGILWWLDIFYNTKCLTLQQKSQTLLHIEWFSIDLSFLRFWKSFERCYCYCSEFARWCVCGNLGAPLTSMDSYWKTLQST